MVTVTMATTTCISPLSPYRPDVGGAYITESVPLRIQEKGLVVLIANSKKPHQVNDGGYESRRDRCYEAARMMSRRSLREATERDIEGMNPYGLNLTLGSCCHQGSRQKKRMGGHFWKKFHLINYS